jgi:beta-phosphoglucomutase-like phosphatase (HAD superfamily)
MKCDNRNPLMSKTLAIFDLDGVLLDSRELHYEALNEAIIKRSSELYVINPEEHLSTYDGLPTRRKLELLSAS